MTTAQVQELEKALCSESIRVELHALSHRLAETFYAQVQSLVAEGVDPQATYDYLNQRFLEYREYGQVIERDAVVEVLDELEEMLVA